ncbi:MAG: paraslipin [Halobacteriovoraceae bacterium]|jgi:regulator of protease activity HflC (stomatin/prohibitin superfamily)|nr:paraslipin [Halobacteriovoraceae bacterium]
MSLDNLIFLAIVVFIFLYILQALIKSLRLVPAQTEFIVERFGRYHMTLQAGFHFLVPFIDRVAFTQNLKEHTMDVPPQTCFTKDEIQVEVDGVIYLQVFDSQKASYGITNFQYASIQLAQTTTRAIIGTLDLDRTFEEREAISAKVVSVLDNAAAKWGVRILRFEIKNLVPPESVRQSMEKQVTAERNRRAILEKSVGKKQSLINTSEGQMRELINNSEGEMQKRINEASGRASEILSLGEATAESIKKVANAINGPGGKGAVKLELGQKYIRSLTKLKSNGNKVIMGGNLADMQEMLSGLDIDV